MTLNIEVGLIAPGRAGGIFITESALVHELRKQPGVTVNVVEFGSREDDESSRQRVASRGRDLFQYYRRIGVQKPDIVYLNSSFNRRALLRDVGYAAISRLRRVNLIIKFHGSDTSVLQSRSAFWRGITHLIFLWCKSVIVLSQEEIHFFHSEGFGSSKLRLMKNGLDLSTFSEMIVDKLDPPGILFIARLIEEKGLLDLLRAAKLLVDGGMSFRIYCVGDGPIRERAERLATELRLDREVEFVGYVPENEAARYYLGCKVLAFPSYFSEGMPMAILQAIASGLAIVSTRVRAVGDYLEEPSNCLWVEPRDPTMLAQRIREVLEDPELRMRMAVQNRLLAQDFEAETVAQAYLQLFRGISSANTK